MPRLSKRAREAEIWGGLLFAHKLVNEAVAADLERETGLPLVWYDVLLILSNSPDGRLRRPPARNAARRRRSAPRSSDRRRG